MSIKAIKYPRINKFQKMQLCNFYGNKFVHKMIRYDGWIRT